jgi:hypothetical protein
VFALATFVVLWVKFFGGRITATNIGCLLLAALFPGQVYLHAGFPMSMCLFFTLLSVYWLSQGRWWQAGLTGATTAFTYPVGFLLAATYGFVAVVTRHLRLTARFRILTVAALTSLGLALVLVIDHFTVGMWNAFFKLKSDYGYHAHLPWTTWFARLQNAIHGDIVAQQTLFVGFIVVLTLSSAFDSALSPQTNYKEARQRLVLAVYTLFFWVFPFVIGTVDHSYFRGELLLLPCVVLLQRLPFPIFVPLLLVALAQIGPISELFFANILV